LGVEQLEGAIALFNKKQHLSKSVYGLLIGFTFRLFVVIVRITPVVRQQKFYENFPRSGKLSKVYERFPQRCDRLTLAAGQVS